MGTAQERNSFTYVPTKDAVLNQRELEDLDKEEAWKRVERERARIQIFQRADYQDRVRRFHG